MAFDRPAQRVLVTGILRAGAAVVIVVLLYFALPLERLVDASPVIVLPVALLGFAALVGWQVVAISRSVYPGLRALEALGSSVPLFLVIFASTYFVLGVADPSWFSEPVSRLDALYFSITVFTTVGFGDITATSPPARVAVTVQMAADLVVIGIGLRVILGAVQEARRREERTVPDAN
jgi:hypothetical protein